MNEKIKQLAEQCNMSKLVDSWEYEQFAQLIVQECNRYACGAWEHGPLLGRDLLIHFGVEE